MPWSYNRLWIMLINRDMKKTELMRVANLNTTALAKMGKKQPVTMETLGKICQALNCRLEDIVEYIPEDQADS